MTDTKPTPNAEPFAALQARFQDQSRRAQAYYAVMHEVRAVLGSDDAASSWMERPLPELGGRSPAQLVGDGAVDQVIAHVRTLRA